MAPSTKVTFTVEGPFEIGRMDGVITSNTIKGFKNEYKKELQRCGCYIFGIRASRGIKPYYVGKASINFDQEVLDKHKLRIYNAVLGSRKMGSPVLFLVCLKETTKPALRQINEVERFPCRVWRMGPMLICETFEICPKIILEHTKG
ncbi:MAG: hypothetical protein IPN44_11470 [Flavobacteriales bacterium]|nr:hypothetical protein [Flavobacteriales bacterium]